MLKTDTKTTEHPCGATHKALSHRALPKSKLILLILCGSLALTGWVSVTFGFFTLQFGYNLEFLSATIALCAISYSAIQSLRKDVFGIEALAAFAVAFSILGGENLPAAIVALMLFGGDLLEEYAQHRATKAIQKLIESQPQTAIVIRGGVEVEVKPEQVEVGELVLVKPGMKVPVDGTVQKGYAAVNQASITGESLPVEKSVGDTVYSGTVLQEGAVYIVATSVGSDSTYGRIIQLVNQAQRKRAPIERTADKYAKYFTPIIVAAGIILFVFTNDLLRVAALFLMACPCALTIATPTSIIASIGNAARKGILIRNGESLEKLAKTDVLVLDKTGTLTQGRLQVTGITPFGAVSSAEVLALAAAAEKCSEHPLAKAIVARAQQEKIGLGDPECFTHHPGLGVHIQAGSSKVTVGNLRLLKQYSIPVTGKVADYLTSQSVTQSVVLVAKDQTVIGAISLADTFRSDVKSALAQAKQNGIKKTILLTGDSRQAALAIAEASCIDEVAANMMPADKMKHISQLKKQGHLVTMVGDGVNDAPALAEADVGIAMGLSGTAVAMETAGVTLATDDLSKIPQLLRISKRTLGTIKQNIGFALIVNALGITLSALGLVPPLLAAALHEGTSLLVLFNALRLLRVY